MGTAAETESDPPQKISSKHFFSFFSHFSDSQMVWQSSIWHSGSIPITIINLKIVFSKSLAIYG